MSDQCMYTMYILLRSYIILRALDFLTTGGEIERMSAQSKYDLLTSKF